MHREIDKLLSQLKDWQEMLSIPDYQPCGEFKSYNGIHGKAWNDATGKQEWSNDGDSLTYKIVLMRTERRGRSIELIADFYFERMPTQKEFEYLVRSTARIQKRAEYRVAIEAKEEMANALKEMLLMDTETIDIPEVTIGKNHDLFQFLLESE